jgi:hypothetical protein
MADRADDIPLYYFDSCVFIELLQKGTVKGKEDRFDACNHLWKRATLPKNPEIAILTGSDKTGSSITRRR